MIRGTAVYWIGHGYHVCMQLMPVYKLGSCYTFGQNLRLLLQKLPPKHSMA